MKELYTLVQAATKLPLSGVKATMDLLESGSTLPFIARYRKEQTGSLDEVQIGDIKQSLQEFHELIARKVTILKAISEQGLLTSQLKERITQCWDAIILEDLYLPYKKKLKTKATIARDNGLEPLAKIIMAQRTNALFSDAQRFITRKVPDIQSALEGARHIISEWINELSSNRELVRAAFKRTAMISSKVIKTKKAAAAKYEQYFELSESLKKCPSHRLLAMLRGEKEGLLRIKITIEDDLLKKKISARMIKQPETDCADEIKAAVDDSMKRLILPSIENEIRKLAKAKADKAAIGVFSENLRNLLLEAPLGEVITMAIDPGFRTGCKVVVLNELGELLTHKTIYPHPPQKQTEQAAVLLKELTRKYKVAAIAIGNGTAGRETYRLVKAMDFQTEPEIYLVNENGASIYSASKLAREEFPDLDLTIRGAVSIGRRLMDPLAELVKIDAKSIGVGQYQHDVNQKLLKKSLESCVESAVNSVGVNLNTASEHLLSQVSGITTTLARNIVRHRKENGPYPDRAALKKVSRMGSKAYELSAGFLRVKSGNTLLDNTGVHPESYKIVEQMCKDLKAPISVLLSNKGVLSEMDLPKYCSDKVGMPTLMDIIKELEKPGLDPRGNAKEVQFAKHVNSIEDLQVGMIVTGVVNNVTKFGAFVDVGVKESGLVHISEIANKFIKDPAEVLAVNQEVKVKILTVDCKKKKISLSIKAALS